MARRVQLSDQKRQAIWRKYEGRCHDCQKKVHTAIDHAKEIRKDLKNIKEVQIYSYEKSCWKCNQTTKIITYNINLDYNYVIGSLETIDLVLYEQYPCIQKVMSMTLGRKVIANVCNHCKRIQGNFYIGQDMAIGIELRKEETIPITLSEDELHTDLDKIPVRMENIDGEIHHIDANPNNNLTTNLVLLCKECHILRHHPA